VYDNEGRGNCNLGAIKVDNKGSKVLLLILVFRCPRELLALTSCVAYTKKAHNLILHLMMNITKRKDVTQKDNSK